MTQDLVTVTIDGLQVQVPKGTSIIEAAKQARIAQKKDVKVYADSPTSSTNLSSGDAATTKIYTFIHTLPLPPSLPITKKLLT